MNVSDVYVFKKVAATLSFTKAARQIGTSRSAISKYISRLENDLGVVLINRTTRSVNLTDAGRTFHEQTSEIDTKIERAADIVRGSDLQPNGTVSFTLPTTFGALLVPALVTQFQATWPELKFNIHFSDDFEDLISSGMDLAIRISKKLDDSSFISRRLASTHKVLAASAGYLEKHGTPTTLEDLQDHRCLGLGNSAKGRSIWRFENDGDIVEVPSNFTISANNHLALIIAACLNQGLIYLPEVCINHELVMRKLQIVLPEFADPVPYGIYALYPHRQAAAKVKVLINFIERELSAIEATRELASYNNAASDVGHQVQPKAT